MLVGTSMRKSSGLAVLVATLAFLPVPAGLAADVPPAGWYAGDVHVHRSCGGSPESISAMYDQMVESDLATMTLLADMGNGEVQDPVEDLPRVTGANDPVSTTGRIVHWDAEWHWDPIYGQYPHHALGGHVVALGLTGAQTLQGEYTYPIFAWAHARNGIAGFAHMQYLPDGFPESLDCCSPLEYPVEVALGAADFIQEDYALRSEVAKEAYYRLLNTGFRPGFAGGSDYPCGVSTVGSPLTYVQVAGGTMTYRNWIEGIAAGRTVVSRNGQSEFLSLTVNGTATPGDQIDLTGSGSVSVNVEWTASENLSGTIELIQNGAVVGSLATSVVPGTPATLSTTVPFTKSGWLAARRTGSNGYEVHTAAVFVIVNGAPIRASAADAQFYVAWIDNLLTRTAVGGDWGFLFTTQGRAAAWARYQTAKALFQQIAADAAVGAPSVTAVVPAVGATSVPVGTSVTATFSEPLAPATVNGSTVELRDGSGVVPATVTWDPATRSAVLDPTADLAYETTYTATIKGGTSGVTDVEGVPLAVDLSWTFATEDLPPVAPSIWGDAGSPSLEDVSDGQPIELGVKFRSSIAGYITSLRFYKGPLNVGTHVGHLWSSGGTLLATVTFSGETASGWQEAPLLSPVAIDSNTTYVASYYSPTGYFAMTAAGLATAATNWPLTALANGTDGGNGVFTYQGGFPTTTVNSGNYWVDVVFSVTPPAPDTTPPTVVSTSPSTDATGVLIGTNVRATFSEALNPATVTSANFELRDAANGLVPAAVTWDSATLSAVLNPTTDLSYLSTYTATLVSGGVTDVAGNPLAAVFTWTFTTGDLPGTAAPNIWGDGYTPSQADETDGQPIEVGVKFRSSIAGYITGLRFYKGPLNVGTHTGHLWSSVGTPLATLTFTGETASGWQQASLSSAVQIDANTTYVASYYTPSGYFAMTAGGLAQAATNWPLTALADGTDGGNGVFTYGLGFPGGSVGANNYWVDVVFSVTPPGPDTTPPTVLSTTPSSGASGVAIGSNVRATFSEALDPVTVTSANFELRDAADQLVTAAVTWDAATFSAVLDPTAALAYSATYTATLVSGGVTDVAGNPLAAVYAWTFTTQAEAAPGSVSIWAGGGSPSVPDLTDGQTIEVGVKFRSSVAGYITGLRFYKGPLNVGTHLGRLWTSAGTLLATVTFSGETESGWQEASLPSPVAIAAGTTYVASYYSPTGHFSVTEGGLTEAVTNYPLTALAAGTDGGNGVYRYGSGFPTGTYLSSNYWVDVVFNVTAPPDAIPPTVLSTTPSNGASGVLIGTNVRARFSEALDPTTVISGNFELRDAGNQLVTAAVTWDAATLSAVLDPAADLAYSATYTATLTGGGVTDIPGNALAATYSWTFTTQATPPPPPEQGPGGPILVIGNAANAFSRYYAEILRAEGLNEFAVLDISAVNATELDGYDVAILGELPAATPLTTNQVAMLTAWVNGGGHLIAMRPDKQLAGLLGLADAASTLANAYLQVDTSATSPGQGIVGETMQFHGTADLYTLAEATAVATLFSGPETATTNPAVTLRSYGSGSAVAFTFDLARSIVYTRQGNPAWAGQKRDGQIYPVRSDDLYYGNASFDPQPDWVNLAQKVAIPQADEQQRLLANLILHMNREKKPLPRFWYLPFGKKAAVVMTSDNHGNGGQQIESRFDRQLSQSPSACSVDNWECVRSSIYMYPTQPLGNGTFYQGEGFEIGVHIYTGCENWTPETLPGFFTTQLGEFQANSQFAGLAAPTTNRTHCIAWSDWATKPAVELQNGIRLDTNYYYWPQDWVADRPGFFTGSGMPMRFAGLDGTMIDVYQATTQITDESGQSEPHTIDTLLDRALGTEAYYGVITANIHTDSGDNSLSDDIVLSAQARGVPVVSAKQMLAWLDGRNGSSFPGISWSSGVLTFGIGVGAGANGLGALLPTRDGGTNFLASLTRNGVAVSYATEVIKGIEYAVFSAEPGTYTATYGSLPEDHTPPVISGVSATVGAGGTATIEWLTDEPANSVVSYGTSPDSLTPTPTASLLLTAHSVSLSGLAANTTHYYTVTSADAAGNSATSSPVSSFLTPLMVFSDTTAAHFALGSPGTCSIASYEGDGAVILAPLFGTEFDGPGLPTGWESAPWTGGAATVSGGELVVNGALASSGTAVYSVGRAIEFVATFRAKMYQHVGFGQTLLQGTSWALFSTLEQTSRLYVRVSDAGTTTDVPLNGSWLGAPHRYRIEWDASLVRFYIDGVLEHTQPVSIAADMRPVVSDYTLGGASLTVDWLRVTPFASPCTFESRVFDAGQSVAWNSLTWSAGTTAAATVQMSMRAGDDPALSGSWTPVASPGDPAVGTGRYAQYRADLVTTNSTQTPVLREVTLGTMVAGTFTLTIDPLPVNGTVSGPGGLSCGTGGAVCSAAFNAGTLVNLVATGETGYALVGWTGACSGPTCAVTMDGAKTVGATFIQQYTLTIDPLPVNGTVTGPGGILCGTGGAVCSAAFNAGTVVNLVATAETGYALLAWTGAVCTGPTCAVTMDAAKTVGATFIQQYTLTIDPLPVNGTVTGPGGLSCGTGGAVCSAAFNAGTVVNLVATGETGYALLAWTGAVCTGPTCAVTMDAAKTVGATFIQQYTLTIDPLPVNGTVSGPWRDSLRHRAERCAAPRSTRGRWSTS